MCLMPCRREGDCVCHRFLKMGLNRENTSTEGNGSCSPVHVDEIFKGDTGHYYQGHRKVRTRCNAAWSQRGFKIRKVK